MIRGSRIATQAFNQNTLLDGIIQLYTNMKFHLTGIFVYRRILTFPILGEGYQRAIVRRLNGKNYRQLSSTKASFLVLHADRSLSS